MIFERLNLQQQLAVQAPSDEPLLIVAGAGTGKTRTLTHRLLYFLKEGVPGEHICALTFTNKAAKEMADRIMRQLGQQRARSLRRKAAYSVPFIGTFHALGAKILRAEAHRLGRTPRFVIFDDHDSFQLVKKLIKRVGEAETLKIGPAFFIEKISQVKNGVRTLESFKHSRVPEDRLAAVLFGRYEHALRKNNSFDFDDLVVKVTKLFEAWSAIRTKYERRFRYILVDEYQDVNPMQHELVQLLAHNHKHVSVVGDDQQLIYSWRYANLETFLGFETKWAGARVVMLEENYRSTRTIVDAASALIAHNEYQKPKTLWTKNALGAPIKVVEVADENEEAEWIADEIGKSLHAVSVTATLPTHIGVLYRTNAQSRALEQALIARRTPYHIFGGLKFYERREIRDITAGLRAATNPRDEISRDRLQKTFSRHICGALEEQFPALVGAVPAAAINAFLKTTDYFGYLEKNLSHPEERRENISELLAFAANFTTLPDFLEEVTLLEATDTPKGTARDQNPLQGQGREGESLVNLMTIHLAKGLEFNRVFIAGCNEGLLPHARSLGSPQEFEEERRLMYVAMTRAKQELSLTFFDLPSRFLGELPDELIEFRPLGPHKDRSLDDEERYITID